jgi:hypothetical protein
VLLTHDHSVLNELVRRGDITEENAKTTYANYRHSLARAVGVCEDVEVDSADFEVLPGDVFVVGSDGLSQYVEADELPSLVEAVDGDLAAGLVALANARGGDDNITAITVRVTSDGWNPDADAARIREFQTKLESLRATPIFSRLDYGELMRLMAVSETIVLAAGQKAVRAGEADDTLYVLLQGRVRIERGPDGPFEVAAGARLGELSLVDRGSVASTAVVTEPARLMRLKRDQVLGLVRREPEIAVKLLASLTDPAAPSPAPNGAFAGIKALVAGASSQPHP